MTKQSDVRQKEVINVRDGKRLGAIVDMELDLITGRIKAIIVPGQNRIFGFLKGEGDVVIPWEKIKKIGNDVILVDMPGIGFEDEED